MKIAPRRLATLFFTLFSALFGTPLLAFDTVLIQQTPENGFIVWYKDGDSTLEDDEIHAIETAATPEGSAPQPTSGGIASARVVRNHVEIRLENARGVRHLLVDRDSCGHVKLWHGTGKRVLEDDQIADLYLHAVPDGGKSMQVGEYQARSFLTKLGVIATFWRPAKRR